MFRSSKPRSAQSPKVSVVIPATLPTMQRPTFRDLALSTRLGRRAYALVSVFLVLCSLGGALVFAAPAASPSVGISGLYTSGAYLCRTWHYDGYGWTHCTHYWHHASGSGSGSGALVSDNPGYVPNRASVVPSPYVPAWVWQGAQAALSGHPSSHSSSTSGNIQPAARTATGTLCQWCFTGIPAQANPDPNDLHGNPSARTFPAGQCTWEAAYLAPASENFSGFHNAWEWASDARARGWAVGTTPRVGATVVFAPGVQGASGLGHVGHVAAVYGGGWFLVQEMNFYWNGGGLGRVSFRYAHTDAGTQFIY